MMRFQIGEKPLRLLFSLAAAIMMLSFPLTGCGTKYEAIDLTEFEETKASETAETGKETETSLPEETEAEERKVILGNRAENGGEAELAVLSDQEASDSEIDPKVSEVSGMAAKISEEASDEAGWNGHTVAIDAGHQAKANMDKEPIGPGSETMKAKMEEGTVGVATGVKEYELTLAAAQKLETQLKERGYKVVMIRNGNDVNLSNAERSEIANESDAEILIRLHANSMENSSVYGALAMCMTEYNPYHASLHSESYALSKKIVDQICSATGTKNRGVQQVDNLSSINWSEIPVSVVEMGFLSNPDEDRWLESDEYQEKLVNGIAAAVDSYFAE